MASKGTLREFECVRCGQTFKSGQWRGCGGDIGQAHVVEPKNYYHVSASFMCFPVMDQRFFDEHGNAHSIPGKTVRFKNGGYITDDPQIQEFLDSRKVGGLLTAEQYEEMNLKPEEKEARAKARLATEQKLRQKAEAELAELRARMQPGMQPAEAPQEHEEAAVGVPPGRPSKPSSRGSRSGSSER